MRTKELTNVKLNFFQNIRKSIYLKNMSYEKASKYDSLPDYLKSDEEVIDAVMSQKPELINSIPMARAIRLAQENPDLLNEVISKELKKEIILTFSDDKKMEYINLLSIELKKEIILSMEGEKKAAYFKEIVRLARGDVFFVQQNIEALSLNEKEKNIGLIISTVYDWEYLKGIVMQLSSQAIADNFEEVLEVVGADFDSVKELLKNISKEEWAKYEDAIQQVMKKAYEITETKEPIYTTTKLFCKEYIELLGIDKVEVLSQYPSSVEAILSLSDKKLEIFAKCINCYMKAANTEEWTQIQNDLMYNLQSGEYDEFIDSLEVIDDTNIEFISRLLQKSGNIYSIKSQEDMENYGEIKQRYCDEWMQDSDIEKKKQAVLEKVFGQDINFSRIILEEYGRDVGSISDANIKDYVECIRLILETNNPDVLEQIYNECEEVTFVNQEFVNKSLKREFFKQYKETLFNPTQGRLIGDNVYDAGTEFNMIVRADDKSEDYKTKYEGRSLFKRQYFSTSYIRQDMISIFGTTAPDVCFGYSQLQEDSLILAGHSNLKSNAHSGLRTHSLSAKYWSPNNMINQTDHHNEMCFRTTQEGRAKLPDYIVVYKVNGHTINMEEAKKAQGDLNDIPIVVSDVNACLEAETTKVNKMIEEYRETQSPELAEKIAWAIKNNRKTYAKMCEWECAKDEKMRSKARDIYCALANNEEEVVGVDAELYANMRANTFLADFNLFDIEQYAQVKQTRIEENHKEPSKFERTKRKIEEITSKEER